MIATQLYQGQGFGNQLFCYVTTRCIAADRGVDFTILAPENLGGWGLESNSLYFMDLNMGAPVDMSKLTKHYKEKERRVFIDTGQPDRHDTTVGIDIRTFDSDLFNVTDGTIIDGIMQSEDYFYHRKDEIKQWLKVNPEYDTYDFSHDDICVIHMRDYGNDPALQLGRGYYTLAIQNMLKINPNMTFIVITNNVEDAKKALPELTNNILTFNMGIDYSIVKNAKYLILGNSTFPFFAAWTSETVRMIIAPKYWARHNVSNGFWACGYNLYRDFIYMDRVGNLQTYDECLREFEIYKIESNIYG